MTRTSISLSKKVDYIACTFSLMFLTPVSESLNAIYPSLSSNLLSLSRSFRLNTPTTCQENFFSADLKWRCPNMHLTSMYGCLHEVCSSNLAHGKNPGWIHIRTSWAYRPGGQGSFRTKIPKFWKSCQDKNADFRKLKFWNQNLWWLSRVLSGSLSIKNPSVKGVGVWNNHLVIDCLLSSTGWMTVNFFWVQVNSNY